MAALKENGSAGFLLGESPDGKTTQVHDINNDPEMEGLSLYEKKALLVNRELDSHGMGKYQWYRHCRPDMTGVMLIWYRYIFILCGMGYMIDLLYAQAFGLVEPAMKQELGFSSERQYQASSGTLVLNAYAAPASGNIFSSFNAGLCAGVMFKSSNGRRNGV